MPRVRVPWHVAWLITRLVAPLVVDYFAYAAHPGASARRSACYAALRRLLRLRRAFGYLDTSRGSSRVSSHRLSSTTSPTPCVRVPQHVAWLISPLVVDYFTARRQLLRRCCASGCLGTSRGSSRGSSLTTPCAVTSSCDHNGSTSATPCVATTCLVATLALLRVRRGPPQRHLPVASRRPFISTNFKLVENGSHAPNNWSESTLTSQLQQQPSRLHHRPPWLHQQSAQVATAKSFI
jgi:hypothetical protein